jgi:hypothetical protein
MYSFCICETHDSIFYLIVSIYLFIYFGTGV